MERKEEGALDRGKGGKCKIKDMAGHEIEKRRWKMGDEGVKIGRKRMGKTRNEY